MSKVSIIVPVYNVGKWLLPCLESIRKQDGSWECILIDDGSSGK
jgi:glycosyltransferase involved in cell wall biosynthesis